MTRSFPISPARVKKADTKLVTETCIWCRSGFGWVGWHAGWMGGMGVGVRVEKLGWRDFLGGESEECVCVVGGQLLTRQIPFLLKCDALHFPWHAIINPSIVCVGVSACVHYACVHRAWRRNWWHLNRKYPLPSFPLCMWQSQLTARLTVTQGGICLVMEMHCTSEGLTYTRRGAHVLQTHTQYAHAHRS